MATRGVEGTKRKRLRWQPIVITLLPAVILYIVFSDASYTRKQMFALSGKGPVTRVELKVVSAAGVNNVVLRDAKQLDSIHTALRQAKRVKVTQGGAHDTWADWIIYKDGRKIDTRVLHSPYNGWMLTIGNDTWSSEYIFSLTKRYAKT